MSLLAVTPHQYCGNNDGEALRPLRVALFAHALREMLTRTSATAAPSRCHGNIGAGLFVSSPRMLPGETNKITCLQAGSVRCGGNQKPDADTPRFLARGIKRMIRDAGLAFGLIPREWKLPLRHSSGITPDSPAASLRGSMPQQKGIASLVRSFEVLRVPASYARMPPPVKQRLWIKINSQHPKVTQRCLRS